MSKKLLLVIDMQNDFIIGSLKTQEAQLVVPKVVKKIEEWQDDIICTLDMHNPDLYLKSREGRKLPIPHCYKKTNGCLIHRDIYKALYGKAFKLIEKYDFADYYFPRNIDVYDYIEIVGLCTDICVIANALNLLIYFRDVDIAVDADCCAGTTPELHEAALKVMRSCQIDILNFESENTQGVDF